MMRRIPVVLLLAATLLAADDVDQKVDALAKKWPAADQAGRARLVEEAEKLGKPGLAALLDKIAPPAPHFPAPRLGVQQAKGGKIDKKGPLVTIKVHVCKGKKPDALQNKRVAHLPEKEAAAVLARTEVIHAPTLTSYAGQQCNISMLTRVDYVRALDGQGQPVKGTVQDGMVFGFTSTFGKDGKTVHIDGLMIKATLQQPMARADGIDLPHVKMDQFAFTVAVPPGKKTVIALPDGSWLLLGARKLILKSPATLRSRRAGGGRGPTRQATPAPLRPWRPIRTRRGRRRAARWR